MINIFKIMICCLFIISLHAFKNIETSKQEILTILQKRRPICLTQFNKLCTQYEKSVITFFDKHDMRSLPLHIQSMEKDLDLLRKTAQDPQFKIVSNLLWDLSYQVTDLITLLKQYIGSINSPGLALKVRHFKSLLPPSVRKRGNVSLFWSLNHRMHC